jgi:hypothetical protein
MAFTHSGKVIIKIFLLCLLLTSVFSLQDIKAGALKIAFVVELIAIACLFIKPPFTIPFYVVFIVLIFDSLLYLWEKMGIPINGNAPFFEMGICLILSILLALIYPRFKKEKPIAEIIALGIITVATIIIFIKKNRLTESW